MLDLRLGFAGLIANAVLPRIKRQLQSPKNVNLAQLAEYSSIDFETISTETEEGQMLKNASGGIAAMLRFKQTELKLNFHLTFFCVLTRKL